MNSYKCKINVIDDKQSKKKDKKGKALQNGVQNDKSKNKSKLKKKTGFVSKGNFVINFYSQNYSVLENFLIN